MHNCFIEFWTLGLDNEMLRSLEFYLEHSKFRKENRNSCKWKISIFKIVMNFLMQSENIWEHYTKISLKEKTNSELSQIRDFTL